MIYTKSWHYLLITPSLSSPRGEGAGGSIFWKTREIGLPSYNDLSTRGGAGRVGWRSGWEQEGGEGGWGGLCLLTWVAVRRVAGWAVCPWAGCSRPGAPPPAPLPLAPPACIRFLWTRNIIPDIENYFCPEMEFLNINLKKDSSLSNHIIHCSLSSFYCGF